MHPLPITLELPDGVARLEPLGPRHAAALLEAGRDERIWRWMPVGVPREPGDVERMIEAAQVAQEAGRQVAFAIVERGTGRVIGSTRYLDIQPENRALEIGWTWIGTAWQRTRVNTECKYLLLRHAFDALGAVRVALKTDARNETSQRAIQRIGASFEGRLRKSRILPDGFIRDTMVYSVVAEEWAGVRTGLEGRLGITGKSG